MAKEKSEVLLGKSKWLQITVRKDQMELNELGKRADFKEIKISNIDLVMMHTCNSNSCQADAGGSWSI